MADFPVSDDIAAAFAKFFYMGDGPSHTDLSRIFLSAGLADFDPYDELAKQPNKQQRVLSVFRGAERNPSKARALVDGLLSQFRILGVFSDAGDKSQANWVSVLTASLRREGWSLSPDGILSRLGAIDLETGGRHALDEQLDRIRRGTDDPGLLLGSAKDLLESVAKFVLEEVGMPLPGRPTFPQLMHVSRERLQILPQQVDASQPGGSEIRKIYQAAYQIADQVNELRADQGTGHGRTLPTWVSSETAYFVVREVCSVADLMLATLDRQYGRR